jgi:hypothetical protein
MCEYPYCPYCEDDCYQDDHADFVSDLLRKGISLRVDCDKLVVMPQQLLTVKEADYIAVNEAAILFLIKRRQVDSIAVSRVHRETRH